LLFHTAFKHFPHSPRQLADSLDPSLGFAEPFFEPLGVECKAFFVPNGFSLIFSQATDDF
jgi:hypothetical protein